MLILATSCIAIWETARVSHLNASNGSGFQINFTRIFYHELNFRTGHHDMGTLYEYERSMDR